MAYFKLENGEIFNTRDIVGIFDSDTATVGKDTRDFLTRAEREGRLRVLGEDIPKSFLLTRRGEVRLTEISPGTIFKRIREGLR